jgi:type IV pilus assembly protein PilQ
MDLKITKDDVGAVFQSSNGNVNPSIDKRELNTTVQVNNGETVVLGGVYEEVKNDNVDKVPFFGDIPGVGNLFKRTTKDDNKKELLVFITPKVVKSTMVSSR